MSGATGSPSEPAYIGATAMETSGAPAEAQTERAGRGRSSRRWWSAVAVGIVVTLPLAWLLSYAGTLPFYLGLFFFVLFGLLVGAIVHRVASPGRPYGERTLLIGTSIIVFLGWSLSVAKEARDFPAERAEWVSRRTRDLGDRSRQEYRAKVEQQIRQYLRKEYPPGGVPGYIRWVLISGELKKGDLAAVRMSVQAPQRRYGWAIRVVFSIALFAFGVGSQTFALRLTRDPAVRAIDEPGRDGQSSP